MKKIITYLAAFTFLFSSCSTFKSLEPLAGPIAAVAIQDSIKFNPSDIKNYYKVLSALKVINNALNNSLTLNDFQAIAKEAGFDSKWAFIGSALYSIYHEKLVLEGDSVNKTKNALNEVIKVLSDALYIINPK